MKKLLIITSLLFTLFTCKTFAQYTPALSNMLNQQHMNQQMAMLQNMHMNRMYWLKDDYVLNNKYVYLVKLKDNTEMFIESKIFSDTTLKKKYIVYEDTNLRKSDPNRKRKIYPSETLKVTRMRENQWENDVTSVLTDSCWLFKVVSGPVNVYSYLSETGSRLYYTTLLGLQAGDGEIVKYDEKNIKPMIASDPNALKLYDRKKYFEAVKKYNKNMIKSTKK